MSDFTRIEQRWTYTGEHPDLPEFQKPWEFSIQVGQGNAKISVNGQPLESDGFSKCVGMILINSSTDQSGLFHIDDIDLNERQTPILRQMMQEFVSDSELSHKNMGGVQEALVSITKYQNPRSMKRVEFQERMAQLNNKGIMRARFILGTDSRSSVVHRVTDSMFTYLGIVVDETITVDTGDNHWGLLYKPEEHMIYVDARNKKQLLAFDNKYSF